MNEKKRTICSFCQKPVEESCLQLGVYCLCYLCQEKMIHLSIDDVEYDFYLEKIKDFWLKKSDFYELLQ